MNYLSVLFLSVSLVQLPLLSLCLSCLSVSLALLPVCLFDNFLLYITLCNLFLSLYLSLYLFLLSPFYLFVSMSVFLCLSVSRLSVYLSLYFCLSSLCLSNSPALSVSLSMSIHLTIYIFLFICISMLKKIINLDSGNCTHDLSVYLTLSLLLFFTHHSLVILCADFSLGFRPRLR